MDFNRFVIFAGILLVALVVTLVGLFVALRGRSARSKTQSPIDDKPAPDWVKNLAGATGKTLTRTESLIARAPDEALVVARDPVTGEWAIEFGGGRYTRLSDIHDDKLASKMLEALSAIQRFAGAIPITAAAPTLPMEAAPQSSELPSVKPAKPVGLEPIVAEVLNQSSPPPSKARYPAPPNSILDQIDKVLQRNLLREPSLAQRKVHVGAAVDGSLLIEVDWNFYKSANDVPEPDVRELIKRSIQEWERTT